MWSGQNISIIHKDAAGNMDRLSQLGAELVAAKVDVLFGSGSQATTVLKRQTSSIPIVMMSSNPVGLGFVASLARPGGNIKV
jgi:putative ABC transport system substrate-binding protein